MTVLPYSKYPADSAEKASSRSKLRSKDANSRPIAQLVALIKDIRDVETDLEPPIFFWQTKRVGESQVHRIIPRQFVCVSESTSQAAAIQDVGIDRGVFVG